MKPVSIVVPVFIRNQHTFKLTNELLSGLLKTHGINNVEIFVVDDGSDQKWINALKKLYPTMINFLHHDKNQGFAAAVNTGIRASKSEWVLLLNNDVQIIQQDWLTYFLNETKRLDLSVAAPKESWLDNNWQYIPDAHRHCCHPNFKYPVGWALLIKREIFKIVGLIPQDFSNGFWEDTLWSFEVKNNHPNFKIGIIDGIDRIKLFHKEHQTFHAENINIAEQYRKNRELFLEFVNGKRKIELPKLGE